MTAFLGSILFFVGVGVGLWLLWPCATTGPDRK